MLQWLAKRPLINWLIVLVYFMAVVLPHKRFGTFLNTVVFKGITRDQYNLRVIVISLLVLCVFTGFYCYNLSKRSNQISLVIGLVLNTLFAGLIIKYLFVINIEVIHFPQYALLTVLLWPIYRNYQQVLSVATFMGIIDEAYQYFYLAPKDTSYYDINDVLTNITGVVFGLLILKVLGIKSARDFDWRKSPALICAGILISAILVMHLLGILSIYPNLDRPYHILRTWPPGFWSTVPPKVTYHVVKPLEGLVLTLLLMRFWWQYLRRT